MSPKAQPVPVATKDNAVTMKLAARYQQIIETHKVISEPVRVTPDSIVVHHRNRAGQAPNIQYIHRTLCPNLMSQGFDPSRPHPGVLVELKSEKAKEKALGFNRDMVSSTAAGILPPLIEDKVRYACLGGNHLTLSLRLMKHEVQSGVTGQRLRAPITDNELQNVITHGHKYLVLNGDTLTDEEAEVVSRWLNSDQDQNQASGGAMLLRQLVDLCKKEMTLGRQVSIGSVIAKFAQTPTVKVPASVLGALTRWVLELGAGSYCTEFLDWYSEHVNPTVLSVSPNWFDELVKASVSHMN